MNDFFPRPPLFFRENGDQLHHRTFHETRCSPEDLMIRARTGLERIAAFLTGERKYRCRRCNYVFRAPDRRRSDRGVPESGNAPAPING